MENEKNLNITEEKYKEQLKVENERISKEQKDRAEAVKLAEEREIERRRRMHDNAGGEDMNKVVDHLAKLRQLDIQANKQGKGAKQEQPYKPKDDGISKLREFEAKMHDKVMEKIEKGKEHFQERTRQ